jgi:hypothetical protein
MGASELRLGTPPWVLDLLVLSVALCVIASLLFVLQAVDPRSQTARVPPCQRPPSDGRGARLRRHRSAADAQAPGLLDGRRRRNLLPDRGLAREVRRLRAHARRPEGTFLAAATRRVIVYGMPAEQQAELMDGWYRRWT